MTTATEIPTCLGGSWEAFSDDWCLGVELGYTRDEVATALSAYQCLLPRDLERSCAGDARGVSVVVPMIEFGLLLDACKGLRGFDVVLSRFNGQGRRATYSELVLASQLRRLGYSVRLEAPVAGKVLDAVCEIAGSTACFEVATPNRSDANFEQQSRMNGLQKRIMGLIEGARVEIEFASDPDDRDVESILFAIDSAASQEWVTVGTVARVRRINCDDRLPPTFDGNGPQIVVGDEREFQGTSKSLVMRYALTDLRAEATFKKEYRHFDPSYQNCLVLNVSAVPGGIEDWAEQVARLFRPDRNRNVGAVVLFDQFCGGPLEKIRRRWRLVVNPHARKPIEVVLLGQLELLDESPWSQLKQPDRIVVG